MHVAYGHNGQKYAVKCQHEGLRESAAGDMAVITFLVYAVSRVFEGFDYNWLTREMNNNMPLELDFTVERANMDKCALLMRDMVAAGDVAVPVPLPALSAQRVLTMTFEVRLFPHLPLGLSLPLASPSPWPLPPPGVADHQGNHRHHRVHAAAQGASRSPYSPYSPYIALI